jgi:diguanylate cyclase (GGDEF)-like protein
MLRQLKQWFKLPLDDHELILSQATAFSRQVPLLYFIIVVNTAILAWSFVGLAPDWLTFYLPAGFIGVCLLRSSMWWTARKRALDYRTAVRLVKITVPFTMVIATCISAWALCLYGYGDAYHQAHVAFFMAISVIGCIFCLMHLRPAALALTVQVIGPFSLFFGLNAQPEFRAIALNVVLVTGALIAILLTYYRDFAQLVESRRSLIAQQEEAERLSTENLKLASRDALTKLPNRRHFFRELDSRILLASETGACVFVALIDLDGFKPINDIYGHTIGDRVLSEAAARLQLVAGEHLSARLGGDEFAICFEGLKDHSQVKSVCDDICTALSEPYHLGAGTVTLSGSMGVCGFPDGADGRARLIERADYALYHAKQRLRGTAVLFSQDLADEMTEYNLLNQALLEADYEDELSIAFQPKFDIRTNRIVGFEALARWDSPTLGPISPARFIPAAERTGLISRLTTTLLRKTLREALTWPEDLSVAFNLSMRDFASQDGVARLIDIIAKSGIAPSRLEFEITETAVMTDPAQARASLNMLKALGASVSLDDFGTGHSSLSYVHQLPLDAIKVDRSFIASLETDPVARNIIKTIVSLCRNLNLDCVIEGVETEAQLVLIRHLGCHTVQGFLFSKPLLANAVSAYILENRQQFPEGRSQRRAKRAA